MWIYDPATGRFRAVVCDRQFDIEQPMTPHHPQVYSLWYRRNEKPHRSLLVGKYHSIDEAKTFARDIASRLVILSHIYQD